MEIVYDKLGRMKYHPEYHSKRCKGWTTSDERYLIEHYVKSGPEHVALALERPLTAIMTKAWKLRHDGRMEKTPANRKNHTRVRIGD